MADYTGKIWVTLGLEKKMDVPHREDAEQELLELYRTTPYADMDSVNEDYIIISEAEKIIIPSKKLAELHDRLNDAMLDAIHKFAEDVANLWLNKDALESVGYDYGLIPMMQTFVDRFIKEAYDIDYESDGTDF